MPCLVPMLDIIWKVLFSPSGATSLCRFTGPVNVRGAMCQLSCQDDWASNICGFNLQREDGHPVRDWRLSVLAFRDLLGMLKRLSHLRAVCLLTTCGHDRVGTFGHALSCRPLESGATGVQGAVGRCGPMPSGLFSDVLGRPLTRRHCQRSLREHFPSDSCITSGERTTPLVTAWVVCICRCSLSAGSL